MDNQDGSVSAGRPPSFSLEALRQFSQSIYEGRRLTPLLTALMSRAAALPGVDTVRVLLADPDRQVLVAQPGTFPGAAHESPVPIGVGFAGRIASTRRPLLVNDLAVFPVYGRGLRDAGVRSAIGVPLLTGDRLMGVIHIGSYEPDLFQRELIPELEEVAERVALTVDAINAEGTLAESEQQFRSLFEEGPIGVCLTDLRPETLGHILLANESLSRLTGYSLEQLTGMNVLDLLAPDHWSAVDTAMTQLADRRAEQFALERRLIRRDGSAVWVAGHFAALGSAGSPSSAVSYLQDISARKDAEAELARRAFTDALTGLANRQLVIDHLALALRQEVRTGRPVGVLYLDLDHFKDINDAHGHDAGDRVLREIATRLTLGMRSADTPGRLGGDEFIVICPQLSSDDELRTIADRLLFAVSTPVDLPDGRRVEVGVSIGVAAGDRYSTPDELVRRADVAMYEAKRLGRRRWERYTEALDRSSKDRHAVDSMLADALREDWFVLHYQPIVDLRTGAPVGVEALLRIQHPQRGLLGPDAFILQLEQSDIADPIEAWVLAQACREWAGSDDTPRFGLAVNVSGRLAASGHLCETVLDAAGDFPPSRLTVEMTERVMVHAGSAVMADIQSLVAHGVRIAIDDFGTGYASLTYLRSFPVSVVKIDRSFVAGLGDGPRDDAIVRAVVTLGASLDMTVVAEGVETPHQAVALRAAGCPFAQGYLLGRPQPRPSMGGRLPARS